MRGVWLHGHLTASRAHCDRAAAPLGLEDRIPSKVGLVRVRIRVRVRVRVPAKVGLGVERCSIGDFGRPSRPQHSLPLGPGQLSGSSRVHSAAKRQERRAQVAGPVSCGATKTPLSVTSWSAGPRAARAWRGSPGGQGSALWHHQEATLHKLVGWAARRHDSTRRPPIEDDGRVARAGAVGEEALGVRVKVRVRVRVRVHL